MNTSSLYRLEIAPLVILPLGRSPFFSYTYHQPVPPGSLVSISFGKQMAEGIVYQCQRLPGNRPPWMKSLSAVLREEFLTKEQRTLAEDISREYFTPLGKTLRHFLPKVVKERKPATLAAPVNKIALRATQEERALLQKLSESTGMAPVFFDTSLAADPQKLWLLIGKQAIRDKRQLLMLVPEITLISSLEARFRKCFGSRVAVLHSKLSPGTFFTAWERIRSGDAALIIATRQGLFAPYQKLETVILTEEQDESYKQWDMSPRYHGKRVAASLAELFQAKLILSSGTPSTESLFLIKEKKLLPLKPIVSHPPLGSALTIVNLKFERYRKNFSPLSLALVEALRVTLGRGEQALLYINRQGMNAFSVCEQCKNVFRCPQCHHPLGSTREGNFRCSSCGQETALFPNCPSCGHLTFRHVGFGTEKVEREVRKLFPHARVARLDSTTLRETKMTATLYKQGMANQIDILIGTQMALKDPPLPKLALIAMIDADSLLLFPDFLADERLFQDVSRAVRQVSGKHAAAGSGQVFIQTFHPESAFFQRVSALKSTAFLDHILTERKELFYPPFARLITLTCQGKTEKEVAKKTTSVRSALEQHLPKEYRLRSPGSVRFLKKQIRFESDILLRFPATDAVLPDTISSILAKQAKECLVDVDPITLK